eukprot:jgi/Orpsp1_1/1192143/evm.model.d7180000090914.1
MEAIDDRDPDKVKSILENDGKNFFDLNNIKNKYDEYPLLSAIENVQIVQLLIDYANKHCFTLDLNKKDKFGHYPLLEATYYNKLEVVKLLIKYADEHDIILEMNGKWCSRYPLLNATLANNLEMVQLLFYYANKHNIHLKKDENDIKEFCEKWKGTSHACPYSEIHPEIFNLWRNNGKIK